MYSCGAGLAGLRESLASRSTTKRLPMGLFTAHALGGVYSRQQEKWVSASRVGFETILCCVIMNKSRVGLNELVLLEKNLMCIQKKCRVIS
ncbi:hypothetical protein TNCV_2317651 [Trichonephila clavipes]|nr:hypothetical protein TNCV_2317651 [Trichonephila clavipes]